MVAPIPMHRAYLIICCIFLPPFLNIGGQHIWIFEFWREPSAATLDISVVAIFADLGGLGACLFVALVALPADGVGVVFDGQVVVVFFLKKLRPFMTQSAVAVDLVAGIGDVGAMVEFDLPHLVVEDEEVRVIGATGGELAMAEFVVVALAIFVGVEAGNFVEAVAILLEVNPEFIEKPFTGGVVAGDAAVEGAALELGVVLNHQILQAGYGKGWH